MGLFSVDYQNVPGQCVYARGGLKFRADENALRRYFSPILPYVSLNDLIGEAVFWVLLPSSFAIWTFPFLLYYYGGVLAVVTTLLLSTFVGIVHQYIYVKSINYLVFIFGNRLLWLAGYIVWALIFIFQGSSADVVFLGVWLIIFWLGLGDTIHSLFLPILFRKKFFSLPLSDQVLRTVGFYYGNKLGMDPFSWRM
jgi:hypothetical protein